MALQPKVPNADARIKLRMIFQGPIKRWSEVHWSPLVGEGQLKNAMTNALLLSNARIALLGNARLVRMEVSVPDKKRNVYRDSSMAIIPSTYTEASQENDSIRILMYAGSTNRASMFLGGVPDFVLNDDILTADGTAGWKNQLQFYISKLIQGGWGFMGAQNDDTGSPRVPIIKIENNPASLNTITVLTAKAHNIPGLPGQIARIGGVPKASALRPVNQLWNVGVTGANTLNLLGFPNQTEYFILSGGGFLRWRVNTFFAYTRGIIKNAGTRKRGVRTGRPPARTKFKRTIGY